MLSLVKNLCGEHFDEYVSACFNIADTFSLTKNGWSTAQESLESERVLKILAPYHICTINTVRWFCQSVPPGHEKEVYLFRATEASKKILLSMYRSIFYDDSVWMTPEDLCFFKNRKLVSGSLTHERICFVYDYESLFTKRITLKNAWDVIPLNQNEQIDLPE